MNSPIEKNVKDRSSSLWEGTLKWIMNFWYIIIRYIIVVILQLNSFLLDYVTLWLFNIAMENPLEMEVSRWENHL